MEALWAADRSAGEVSLAATPHLREVQVAMELSLTMMVPRPSSPTAEALRRTFARGKEVPFHPTYQQDLMHTLDEMATCVEHGCHVATLVLAGKVLEMVFRKVLDEAGVVPGEPAMLGTLFRTLREKVPAVYVDPGLGQIASLIQESRNLAIHQRVTAVPVPSENQATMVVFAVLDVLDRQWLSAARPGR